MILLKAVTAYIAIQQLMEREMDYESAHALLVMKNRLKEHAEFYIREEQKLAQTYGERDADGRVTFDERGRFHMKDETAAQEYAAKRAELAAVPVEDAPEPVTVRKIDRISPAQIEALTDIVNFE